MDESAALLHIYSTYSTYIYAEDDVLHIQIRVSLAMHHKHHTHIQYTRRHNHTTHTHTRTHTHTYTHTHTHTHTTHTHTHTHTHTLQYNPQTCSTVPATSAAGWVYRIEGSHQHSHSSAAVADGPSTASKEQQTQGHVDGHEVAISQVTRGHLVSKLTNHSKHFKIPSAAHNLGRRMTEISGTKQN